MSVPRAVVHPLFIPKGSVRALVTLIVTSAVCFRLVTAQPVAVALSTALFIVLAYYFAHRGAHPSAQAEGRSPLFLPRGTVRTLLVLGLLATAVLMWRRGGRAPFAANAVTVATLGSFFAGVLFQALSGRRKRNPAVKTPFLDLFNHLKALLVLGAAGFLGFAPLVGLAGLQTEARLVGALAAIAFYFGSR